MVDFLNQFAGPNEKEMVVILFSFFIVTPVVLYAIQRISK